MKQFRTFLVLLICIGTTSTFASNPIKLSEPGYAGNGCPKVDRKEETTLILNTNKAVTVILSEMTLSTLENDRNYQRKKCDIALGVTVESGNQIRIEQAKLEALVMLDSDSSASVTLETGFAANKFTTKKTKYAADTLGNTELTVNDSEWSECGSDVIVRTKASAVLRGNETQTSYLSVNYLSFKIAYQTCK